MQFCPICPTKYLYRFTADSRTHLVLANFYGRDIQYAEWYRNRGNLGDTIILDNGAYEKELVDPLELLRVILDLKPTVVILPDHPNNFRLTVKASQDFAYMPKACKVPVQTLQVVHAEPGELQDFEGAYLHATLSADWVALSRLTPAYGLPDEVPELRRVQFIRHLMKKNLWRNKIPCHCLGMLNGSLLELPELAKLGVNSIDSSAPIWRGLNNHHILAPWTDIPFNVGTCGVFDLELAATNLKLVQEACDGTR